jgi:hypothetical protein
VVSIVINGLNVYQLKSKFTIEIPSGWQYMTGSICTAFEAVNEIREIHSGD